MLQIVDAQWKDHLYSLDHLKEGIGLRGYGQRDPLVEYKKESFEMFQDLMDRIDEEILRWTCRGSSRSRAGARRRSRRPERRRGARAGADAARVLQPSWPLAARRPCRATSPSTTRAPAQSAFRRRRRTAARPARSGGDDATVHDGQARRAEGRPQRPVPLRQRQEVQEVPRGQLSGPRAPVPRSERALP